MPAAKPPPKKKQQKPLPLPKKKIMRGGSDCAGSPPMFMSSTQGNLWVSGIPFGDTGDGSGNQNPVLAAYNNAESVVMPRVDSVMYAAGLSAPVGTPFTTGGGTKKKKKTSSTTTKTKKAAAKKK